MKYELANLIARALRREPVVEDVQECLTRDHMPYAEVTIGGKVYIVSVVEQWS